MSWIPQAFQEACEDALCGGGLGMVKGILGVSLFTSKEVEEINSLKKLALSVLEKSLEIKTDPIICEGIQAGKIAALDSFAKKASPEVVAAGVV